MADIPEYVQQQARYELARRYFYDYCRVKYPDHYTDNRGFLKDVCDRIQAFSEQNKNRFLVINMPPRHYKSFTGTAFVEWYFGNHPDKKVLSAGYNETLSTTFARKVRDTIEERKSGDGVVYSDIFHNTKVKRGQASASLWALDGSFQDSYLATSPTGTATGFGANFIVVDDIIKNETEAYNEIHLDKLWSWWTNTMMQRTEGNDWKIVVIMTRWAKGDLAGHILSKYTDVEHITYTAVQEDGSMLCDDILTYDDYVLKTQEMAKDIVEANYNQKPIDIKGRLYNEFSIWTDTPSDDLIIYNITDTADQGKDNLCSINYFVHNDEAYITDVVYTDEPMETTEPLVIDLLYTGNVNRATIESNNGGRGFARNIERGLKDKYGTNKITIVPVVQTKNKESRILASSAWVQQHVHMPYNWQNKFPKFYNEVMTYQRKGKNAHDDAVDVLASIYETITGKVKLSVQSKTSLGFTKQRTNKRRHRGVVQTI